MAVLLATDFDDAERARWLSLLREGLPGETLVTDRSTVDDAANCRHVPWLQLAGRRVRQHAFDKRLDELFGTPQQRVAQIVRPVERSAVGQLARRVNRHARVAIAISPLSGGIEVFEREAERIHHRVAGRTRRVRPMLRHHLAHRERLGRADVFLVECRDALWRRRGRHALELVGPESASEQGGAPLARQRALQGLARIAVLLHQDRSRHPLVDHPHVRGGGDEHAQAAGPRLRGQAVDEGRLSPGAHHRHHVTAGDAQGAQDHGPVYAMTNSPPVMSLATIRFDAGKM